MMHMWGFSTASDGRNNENNGVPSVSCLSSCPACAFLLCPGEDVYIGLHGACEELSVHLQPDVVLLKSTYLSLSTVHRASLTNTSDVPLQYRWTTWPSLHEEALSLLRWKTILHRQPTTVVFIVWAIKAVPAVCVFCFFFFPTTWISRNSPGVCHSLCLHLLFFPPF